MRKLYLHVPKKINHIHLSEYKSMNLKAGAWFLALCYGSASPKMPPM
jgi:hypothetical protein